METERWHRNSWWLCKDWKTAWRNKSLDGQFLFLQKKKSIPNFQRCFVSGLLFSFHNSQCGPRPLNVIMQRGRTGTISPLKPLYWHTCKTKINCSLLPTPLMPASARNFFWFFFFFTFSSLRERHFIFTFCWQLEFSKWGKQGWDASISSLSKNPCNIRCCYDSELYVERGTGIWAGFICNAALAGLIWKDRWRQTL